MVALLYGIVIVDNIDVLYFIHICIRMSSAIIVVRTW